MALHFDPGNALFYGEMGFVANKFHEWDEAIRLYPKVIDLDDTEDQHSTASAWRGIGFALIEKGQLAEAEKAFCESLTFEQGNELALEELMFIENLRRGSGKISETSITRENAPFAEE